MKQLKQTLKRTKKSVINVHEAILQSERDFRDAVLVVSITANIFVVCLWVAVMVTSQYDKSLVAFFFGR